MYREVDSVELAEWQAYYDLEPFGDQQANIRAGIIAATIANVNRKKNTRAFIYDDFILTSKLELEHNARRRRKQSTRQLGETLMGMTKKKKKNGN